MAGAAACFLVVVSVSFSQLLVCEAVVEKRPRHHAWSQAGEGKDGGGDADFGSAEQFSIRSAVARKV